MNLLKKFESLNFAELKLLSDAEITAFVTKNEAIKICATAQAPGASEVLHLWIKKLLKTYNAVQFAVEDWKMLTECLRCIFQQILGTPLLADNLTEMELNSWLGDTNDLLKWFQPLIPELNVASTCIVLAFTLDTVVGFLSYYRQWAKDTNLKRQLQTTLSIHSFILKVLNENVSNFRLDSKNEFSHLTELIASLCEVGEQTSPVDIKTIVETWKCIAKITAHCAKYAFFCNPPYTSEIHQKNWATRPFKYLLKEVSRNVTLIYKEDTLDQPVEQVEKYLRVTNFYLKLLQMLTAEFPEFPFANDFFKVLILSISMPKYLVGTQIDEILKKYVLNILNEILQMVYKSNDIRELLLSHLRKCNKESSLELARQYLHANVTGRDCKFIDNNFEMYAVILKYLVTDSTIFTNSAKYSEFIELLAALTILSETKALKSHFRENILKADFPLAHISTDVLLLVLRCTIDQTKTDDALREFRYWRQWNETFALMSNNLRQLNIQCLLRHTFKMCQSLDAISNNALWDQFSEWQLLPSNYRFFLAVGLTTTSSSKSHLQSLIIRLTDELFELIIKCEAVGCSTDIYYKMIIFIELLSTANVAPKNELFTQLLQIVSRLYSNPNSQVHNFEMFLNVFHNLSTTYADVLPVSILQQIVDSISNNRKALLSLPEIDFLMACCNNVNPKLQETAKNVLTKLDVTKKASENISLQCEIFKEIYENIFSASCHVCEINKPTFKRQRQNADEDDGGPSLKIIVNDILKKTKNVVNLSSQLDNVDFNILNSVVNNLKILLDNKK